MTSNRKFIVEDGVKIEELSIECPVCNAKVGDWCNSPGRGVGLHAKRIEAYAANR